MPAGGINHAGFAAGASLFPGARTIRQVSYNSAIFFTRPVLLSCREPQGIASPETGKKIVRVATVELIIELTLIVLLFFVLRWPADLITIAIIIFPSLPCGIMVMYLILHDKKESPA
jgi:hypothetical protein